MNRLYEFNIHPSTKGINTMNTDKLKQFIDETTNYADNLIKEDKYNKGIRDGMLIVLDKIKALQEPEALFPVGTNPTIMDRISRKGLQDQILELQKFKEYVHDRLDKFGVPRDVNPKVTKDTGCRIGSRLDYVFHKTKITPNIIDMQLELRTKEKLLVQWEKANTILIKNGFTHIVIDVDQLNPPHDLIAYINYMPHDKPKTTSSNANVKTYNLQTHEGREQAIKDGKILQYDQNITGVYPWTEEFPMPWALSPCANTTLWRIKP